MAEIDVKVEEIPRTGFKVKRDARVAVEINLSSTEMINAIANADPLSCMQFLFQAADNLEVNDLQNLWDFSQENFDKLAVKFHAMFTKMQRIRKGKAVEELPCQDS